MDPIEFLLITILLSLVWGVLSGFVMEACGIELVFPWMAIVLGPAFCVASVAFIGGVCFWLREARRYWQTNIKPVIISAINKYAPEAKE